MTDEDIRTLPLDEIARRCPNRTAMLRAVHRAEEIAYRIDAKPDTLSGEIAAHLERRALLLARDYLVPWTEAAHALEGLGEALARVAPLAREDGVR